MMQKLDIDQYVASCPERVRKPVQELREAGHVDDNMLATVILGAPRKDQRYKLLYHLLLVRGLRDARIEVDDTVAMARAAGRTVDFQWSHRRWKNEHNRLSRWATLKRLSSSCHTYNLDAYTAHLPAKWPGYLISTSKRLGMEGLRQRHCIASYDARIATGQCTVAVVFLDQKRWTVELYLTRDPEQPVYMRNIKGAYNRDPSREERDAVLAILNLPSDWRAKSQWSRSEPIDQRREAIDALELALPVLRGANIDHVNVSFDGYGDSGMIEEPEFYGSDGEHISVSGLACLERTAPDDDAIQRPLKDVVYNAVEQYLNSTGVDWYNDSGGFGEFVLDVEAGAFRSTIDVRYTEHEPSLMKSMSLR